MCFFVHFGWDVREEIQYFNMKKILYLKVDEKHSLEIHFSLHFTQITEIEKTIRFHFGETCFLFTVLFNSETVDMDTFYPYLNFNLN